MPNAVEFFVNDVAISNSGSLICHASNKSTLDNSSLNLENDILFCANSGSMIGSAESFGAELYLSASSKFENHIGMSNTLGVEEPLNMNENHSLDIISNETPSPAQGINFVEINPAAILDVEEEQVLPVRDLTRYRKSYSYTRKKPVRLRLLR